MSKCLFAAGRHSKVVPFLNTFRPRVLLDNKDNSSLLAAVSLTTADSVSDKCKIKSVKIDITNHKNHHYFDCNL